MKHDIKKISKIIDELTTFCLIHGANNINMNVENSKEYFKISFYVDCLDYKDKRVSRLERLLNVPRQTEMEEFYWELTGESDHDSELSIVGMMIDKVEFIHENESLKIILYRYK
ncbi:hypothetical protein [Senegalia massiliensis]|uniref:Uncharacterized protein n=1 Tax=Senegalia massiliensis TaxID=1720316 RepID=A0A845QTX3_9CLOT|nr:hypothetical protein [Senegalia massiliensis]NBI05484.1 hypothetical protein [Senegalia massiliensis]